VLADVGPVVVMSDEIHAARFVTKSHATSPGAFTSPTGPIGQVAESDAAIWFRPFYEDFVGSLTVGQLPRVQLVTMVVGMGPTALQAVIETHPDGLVIEGFGGGHVPPNC
jgi:L-asparaginase